MSIIASFIIAKKVETTQILINRSIYIMECYLAIRRNEVLISVTTWMNLENSVLSKKSQTQMSYIV